MPAGFVAANVAEGDGLPIPVLTQPVSHDAAVAAPEPEQQVDTSADTKLVAVAPADEAPSALPVAEPAPLAAPAPPPPPPLPTSVKASPIGVPTVNMEAYRNAERILAVENPHCGMSWNLLAGIGRVESTHANDGKAAPNGNLDSPIYGPLLDGHLGGNNVISDTDGGALDGNASYDRAMGPMQFIPQTWKRYAGDGNGDGVADPQNLFDAALTTGKYLCDGGLDMRDISQQSKAILRYNNSMAYVANVMAWSLAYGTGIAPSPAALPAIH